MKKIFSPCVQKLISIFLMLFMTAFLFAEKIDLEVLPITLSEGFAEYQISNGMKVFVLEDFSSALVRVEFASRSGISMQSAENAGFFPLYAKLFRNGGKINFTLDDVWYPEKLVAECNADSSRFYSSFTSEQLELALEQIASCAFNPLFLSEDIEREFGLLKNEVTENSFSIEGFINGSINSRVFSEAPWQHDSGIYPTFFTEHTISKVRSVLSEIGKKFYAPQNSAIFISGAISKKDALEMVEKSFGKYPSHANFLYTRKENKDFTKVQGKQKLFVLADSEFSSEMTQIVMQYKDFSMSQCDIISAALNNSFSSLKNSLLSKNELSIISEEYINVDSAHKNGSSRLIIQSLLGKTKTNAAEQTEIFVNEVKENVKNISDEELQNAKKTLIANTRLMINDSSFFMELLSSFWAIDGVPKTYSLGTGLQGDESSLLQRLLNQPEIFNYEDDEKIREQAEAEEPYVFVLINSDVYKKNKKQFTKMGFEQITKENSSWYMQKVYENVKAELTKEKNEAEKNKNSEKQTDKNYAYYKKNLELIKTFSLKNNIPVVVKENDASESVIFSVMISGGELYNESEKDYGLESVLINALAFNIQKEINKNIAQKNISEWPIVLAETGVSSSLITVECLYENIELVANCIANTFIYGDIIPSVADSLIYDRRSNQIMKTGSSVFQLYAAGFRILYDNTSYENIFTVKNDILKNVSYEDILESYPLFLDASRLSLIISGRVNEKALKPSLENNFGLLKSARSKVKKPLPQMQMPKKPSYKIQLQHKFLTDVSKEKAGPRPAILIPTTDFSDPVQIWTKVDAKKISEKEIFNALCFKLKEYIELEIHSNKKYTGISVQLKSADNFVNAGIFSFINVKNTYLADELYKETSQKLILDLENENILFNEKPETNLKLLSEIKNSWILETLFSSETNRGTVLLIKNGLDSSEKNPTQYLESYKNVMNASISDFTEIAKKYFAMSPILTLYSADSKK